jgi:hypothetical protein
MTEAEALIKWCPFVRFDVQGPEYSAANRWRGAPGPASGEACCIGSACMAWRKMWRGPTDRTAVLVAPDAPPGWTEEGYCGLAGKP